MSVVEYKGLFMIKNGYRRAFALREKDIDSFLPCCSKLRTTPSQEQEGRAFFNIDLMMSEVSSFS